MHEEPALALRQLIAALERHLDTCTTKREGSDQEIQEAYDQVASAFEKYEMSWNRSMESISRSLQRMNESV